MVLVKADKGLKYVGKEPSENLPGMRISGWGNYYKEKCLTIFDFYEKYVTYRIFFFF